MKRILVVIDVQKDFVDGALGNAEAVAIVPNVVKKINEGAWDGIVVTLDTHGEDYLKTKEGARLPVVHCIKNTPGWQLDRQVSEALSKVSLPVLYIEKPTFGKTSLMSDIISTFGDEHLDITVTGLMTDICVVSNALILKAAGYDKSDISVDSACCAGTSPEAHEAALRTMASCQIDIL
ncbi:MAG: cysteine hydrolase [Bacteroidales bacterium]|nr:cysteine hydrolase [Bacteroidales bacterium]